MLILEKKNSIAPITFCLLHNIIIIFTRNKLKHSHLTKFVGYQNYAHQIMQNITQPNSSRVLKKEIKRKIQKLYYVLIINYQ